MASRLSPQSATFKLPVEDLHFDRQNPRLAEYGVSAQTSEEEVLRILWDAMDVRELVQSIKASGFFPHEPLIVADEKGKHVVIEGNRRLAAVKVLRDPILSAQNGWEVPRLTKAEGHDLSSLPVLISTREDSWRYLGFKHVNGPAKWSSYAKAKYIAFVHRDHEIQLEDIAYQIGDGHRTVQRLYRGLMVIEQAERAKVFDREDRFRARLAFSHMYTALDYDGFSTFLSLKSEGEEATDPVPKKKLSELGELCVWLFGSKRENRAPVIQSQNPDLRHLDAVLKNRGAVAALRAGRSLDEAYELSRPATAVLEEALLAAKRDLTTVRAHLTTGYDGSEDLLRIAGTVAELADDVYREMEHKKDPVRKPRLTEE